MRRALTGRDPGCADGTHRDELCEMVSRFIYGRQPRDRVAAIGHDDLLTVADALEIPTEVVLELSNTDLDTRCSYSHSQSVATTLPAATVLRTPLQIMDGVPDHASPNTTAGPRQIAGYECQGTLVGKAGVVAFGDFRWSGAPGVDDGQQVAFGFGR